MKIPLILASDMTGLVPILLGIPAVAVVMAVLSILPARRGHWSVWILSTPPLLVGLLCTLSLFTEGALSIFWIIFPLPLLISGYALVLWFRHRAKKEPIQPPVPTRGNGM